MGEVEGVRNSWGYVEGGNGALSAAVARVAESHGALLCTEAVRRAPLNSSPVHIYISLFQPVSLIRTSSEGRANGVVLEDGTEVTAKIVLSNATPKVTYLDLIPKVRYTCTINARC